MTEPAGASATISPDFLELLACPLDHATVRLEGGFLICTECGRQYPIDNGIPNMLVDDEE